MRWPILATPLVGWPTQGGFVFAYTIRCGKVQ